MANPPRLTIPPPARVPISRMTVAGVDVQIILDPEWARYLDALTAQLAAQQQAIITLQNGGGAGAAFAIGGGGGDGGGGDVIPGPQGNPGQPGATGPMGQILLAPEPEAPDFFIVPGQTGSPGPAGSAGAAGVAGAWLPIEPEQPDFLPIPGPKGDQGNAGATGPAGAQGGPGPWLPADPEPAEWYPGPPGNQGPQGNAGTNGVDGSIGYAVGMLVDGTGEPTDYVPMVGPPGTQGVQGTTGNTGAQGAIGPGTWLLMPDSEMPDFFPVVGATGATGNTGAQGPTGPSTGFLMEMPEFEAPLPPYALPIPVAMGGTGDAGSAWTTYALTVTASSGTFTTVSGTGAYKDIGKTRFINLQIVVTTNGTAAAIINCSMPNGTSVRRGVINGVEGALTGNMIKATIDAASATFNILDYKNAYCGGTGALLWLCGVVEMT